MEVGQAGDRTDAGGLLRTNMPGIAFALVQTDPTRPGAGHRLLGFHRSPTAILHLGHANSSGLNFGIAT